MLGLIGLLGEHNHHRVPNLCRQLRERAPGWLHASAWFIGGRGVAEQIGYELALDRVVDVLRRVPASLKC